MNDLENIISNVITSIIIVIVGLLLYKGISYFLTKSEENFKLFTSSRGKTYLKLLKSTIRYILIIVSFLVILEVNGVNVSSILAGVGIFGVIFGLAIQDWLKDIIRGSSIISDGYFEVGDIIRYKDIEGKVLVIGLKSTKIQELATRSIISIANRNIEEVEVISKYIHVRIPLPYDIKLKKEEKVVDEIIELIKNNKNVNNCTYLGITEFKDSFIEYLLEIECNPQHKLQVRRDALKSILLGLENNNIQIPFTQIDIHNK